MNRTRKLMATITTSLFLTTDLPPGSVSVFGQTTPKEDDSWKTDKAVGEAAEQIFSWLKGTTSANPKTIDDIAKQFPKFSSSLIDNALKRLTIYERVIVQAGTGTKDDPYRYYEYAIQRGGFGG